MIEYELKQRFLSGMRYTNQEIKDVLQILYRKHGIDKKPKTTDLLLLGFTIKRAVVKIGDDEYKEGLLLEWKR